MFNASIPAIGLGSPSHRGMVVIQMDLNIFFMLLSRQLCFAVCLTEGKPLYSVHMDLNLTFNASIPDQCSIHPADIRRVLPPLIYSEIQTSITTRNSQGPSGR